MRWKSPVTPGDQLVMEMTLESFDQQLGFAKMTGKAYVGGKVRTATLYCLLSCNRFCNVSLSLFVQIAVQVDEFTFALARS